MQFEVIRKSHKKEIIIGVIAIILIVVVLVVRSSFAKYQTTKNMKIVEGTINYTMPDFKVMAMYKNDGNGDTPIETMPESGYIINTEKSYCTTDNINKVYNKVFTNEEGKHVITGLSKDSKCYIYFDKKPTAGEIILENVGIKNIKDIGNSFAGITPTSDIGLFVSKTITGGGDNDGDTYYFRGAVKDNYVEFAGYYWRIIRINGDGTIRLIYQGISSNSIGEEAQIGMSAFNVNYQDNAYVGFKYTNGDAHGIETESTMLTALNTWYTNNLKGHEDKIDKNAGFCGDREPSTNLNTSNGSGGTGNTSTYYGAYIRIVSTYQTTINPTFKCQNNSDLFTKNVSVKGNKTLTNPIGLITADEAVYAGGGYRIQNENYYLSTKQMNYWTMSPSNYNQNDAKIFYVLSSGNFGISSVKNQFSIRPVINLCSDVTLTGTGTSSDPYIVS